MKQIARCTSTGRKLSGPAATLGLCLVLCAGMLAAQTSDTKSRGSTTSLKTEAALTKPEITEGQQRAVQEFVRAHHPELDVLLAYLQQHRPTEYDRAVRDLYRNVARIESWRERDPERYQLELRLWQLESQTQLLAARVTMLDEQQRHDELRELLRQQLALRIELLKRERSRVAERLSKLDQQIAEMQDNQDQMISRQLQTLLRSFESAKPKRATNSPTTTPNPRRNEKTEKSGAASKPTPPQTNPVGADPDKPNVREPRKPANAAGANKPTKP